MMYLPNDVYKYHQSQGLYQCWHELHCSPDYPREHHDAASLHNPVSSMSLIIDCVRLLRVSPAMVPCPERVSVCDY